MADLNTLTVLYHYVTLWCLVVGIPSAQTITFTDTIVSVNITRGNGRGTNFTDRINLAASDTSMCDDSDQLKTELVADCKLLGKQGGLCYLDCSCLDGTTSFVLSEKRCADDRKFREGCYFVFGSWTWTSGWTWNTQNDPLQVLYVENGYGLTSGFNASTSEFSQCTFTSTAIYDEHRAWKPFTASADESIITFFKFRGMWHLTWIIEDLSTTKVDEIEGKFIKMYLTCGSENSINGTVETSQQSSCIVFKVTGNLTYRYEATTVKTTSSSTDQISSVILQTSYTMAQSSSQSTDQYEATTVKTTSSLTDQISSVILQTSYLMAQSSSPISQTESLIRQTVQTNVPIAQTSGIIDKTQAPGARITTVQSSSSTLQATISISNTNTTSENTDDTQIGVIIGAVIGGSVVILILTATIVLSIASFCHNQPRRSKMCTDIPMRHKRALVLPESV